MKDLSVMSLTRESPGRRTSSPRSGGRLAHEGAPHPCGAVWSLERKDRSDIPVPGPSPFEGEGRQRAIRLPTIGKSFLLFAALGAACALAGCATNAKVAGLSKLPTGQFPLTTTTQTTGIQLTPHKKGLSASQIEALRGLVADWRASGEGLIIVEVPACACDDAAEAGYDTRDALKGLGVPEGAIRMLGYEAQPDGPIRVSFQKISAKTYDCSASWDDLTKTGDNRPYKNFGCATAANHAAMIDRPADLGGPRPADPANGAARQVTIERYRTGADATAAAAATTGGAASSTTN